MTNGHPRFTLLGVLLGVLAALPPPLESALAVAGAATFVLAAFPAFVGFVGLVQQKPLDQIRDDATYALYASVPLAGLAAIATIIYLLGASP